MWEHRRRDVALSGTSYQEGGGFSIHMVEVGPQLLFDVTWLVWCHKDVWMPSLPLTCLSVIYG